MQKTTKDYLDIIFENHDEITNDSQLAATLGITRQAVYAYRRGQAMSATVALRVALVLKLHPLETISATMLEQCGNAHDAKLWAECYEKYKSI